MDNMWAFLDKNQWWGCMYLVIICLTFIVSVNGFFHAIFGGSNKNKRNVEK